MGTPLVFLGGRVEDPDDDPAFSGSVYSQPEAKGLQDAGPVVQDQLSVLLVWPMYSILRRLTLKHYR